MRDIDKREFSAVHGDFNCKPLLKFAALDHKCSFVAKLDGEPVFIFGVTQSPFLPHLGHAWGFGTDKTIRVMPEMTAFLNDIVRPDMSAAGVKRIEVRVLDAHTQSRNWFENHLNARLEARLDHFGRNGEAFYQYAWITP